MGNKSSSVSLEEERRANDPAATQPPAKASLRETLFKHRKSFRKSRALNKSPVKAGEGPGHDKGSAAAPADILGSSSARAATSQGHLTSSAVPVPCGAVLQASTDASAVSCQPHSKSSSGSPKPHPAEQAALGTSEPTYEEIRTGASPSGDATTSAQSLRSPDVDRSSGGLAGRLSSSSDAVAEVSLKFQATVGIDAGESVKAGGSGGSRLRVVLGSLFPHGKKSTKKRKSLGGHGNDPAASEPGSTGDTGRPSSRSSGGSSGRQSGQHDGGSDVQHAKSCGDRGSGGGDDGGTLTATHRRAASYERQLPNLPIGQSSGSDETIPKRRCSEDESPKLRRALPDIPDELPSSVDCGETLGDQIYSDVTDMPPPPSGAPLSSAPSVSVAVVTTAGGDAYDEIQRDRNPASVKADHLTYAAVDELTAAVSSCVGSTDGMYDMLQRDKNPLSVKMQQLKLNKGKDADDDQYSKAVETPPFGSTFGVDSGEIYCDADAVRVSVVTSASGTVGVSAGCGPVLVVGSDRSSGAPTIYSSQVGLRLSATECSETRTSGASSSAAAGGLHGSVPQHPPPYSVVKPVAPATAAVRIVDRHTSLTPIDVDTTVDSEPPRVPEKHFDLCDELRSIDGIMQRHALESSAVVAGCDDDDSELYSLPIETSSATASTAAGCSNSGDLPAGYGIITLREPLSLVQERLAVGDGPIANAEESDYYESVDKVDPSGVIMVSELASDQEPGLVPSLAGTESDAAEVYAVPDELVNTTPGSAGLPPVPPPVPQGTRRRQAASAYEEIKFPAEGDTKISADASSERTGLKCASLPAGGSTRITVSDNQPAEQNAGTGSSQVRLRRCVYEEVDLPATLAAKPLTNGSHESAAIVPAVEGDTCVLFIPPPASDRPLARPLANRGRLAHHYEEVDGPDEGGRPATALKIAGARQPHLYDEIEDIVQQRT